MGSETVVVPYRDEKGVIKICVIPRFLLAQVLLNPAAENVNHVLKKVLENPEEEQHPDFTAILTRFQEEARRIEQLLQELKLSNLHADRRRHIENAVRDHNTLWGKFFDV